MNCLVLDIDGTIADTTIRTKIATDQYPDGHPQFYSLLFDGSLIPHDTPIVAARDFLIAFVKDHPEVKIIYLSGRPMRIYHETEKWLSDHLFPKGDLILRTKGPTVKFKSDYLLKIKHQSYNIIAFIGDSNDDLDAALDAKIKFIQVPYNGWKTSNILDGMNHP